jgi:hypothetical protein
VRLASRRYPNVVASFLPVQLKVCGLRDRSLKSML